MFLWVVVEGLEHLCKRTLCSYMLQAFYILYFLVCSGATATYLYHSRPFDLTYAGATNNNNDGSVPFRIYRIVSLTRQLYSKGSKHVIDIISYTYSFPAMTGQNVCRDKDL